MMDRLILRADTARLPDNPISARWPARGVLRPPLRSEDLIERAQRRAGFADFGDTPFHTGLDQFLRACNDEADLSLFGYFGTRWDVCRFLTNLLRLRREELERPDVLDLPVDR